MSHTSNSPLNVAAGPGPGSAAAPGLQSDEERFRRLVDSAHEGVWELDANARATYINARMAEILGRTPEDAIGRTIPELVGAPDATIAMARFARRQTGEAGTYQGTVLRPDGTQCWVRVSSSPIFAADGSFAGVVALVSDRTEQRRAEEELTRSEHRYRALIENSSDMTTLLDEKGVHLYVSPAHERYLGYAPGELLGRTAFEFVHADDIGEVLAEFARLLEQPGGRAIVRLRHRHADGSWRAISSTGTNLLHDPAMRGIVVNSRDVTEEQALATQLRQSQKMEAVGRLAAGVAHDFNNLLTVIQNYSRLVAAKLPSDSELRSDIDEVLSASLRAADLTRQLLAFGRKQMLRPQRTDLNETVTGVTAMLRRVIAEDIMLEMALAGSLWPVHADPGQLEQVLMNLAVNARDAMADGGTITLRTANVEVDWLAARARPGLAIGKYVSLTIEDTGAGIDSAILPHIFEPFYTTKAMGAGTGLGLATVHGIVHQSGGHVFVESTPGEGSRFTVLLPVSDKEDTPTVLPPERIAPRGSEMILLVEDEPHVRMVVRQMLERQGYTVRDASSAAEARRIVDAEGDRIGLVLTDVIMPELNGRALAEQLALRSPGLKFLFMSGYADDEILRRGLMRSDTPFLEKPFTPEQLAHAVRAALSGATHSRPMA